jgi:AcrR family transcriptional regulator
MPSIPQEKLITETSTKNRILMAAGPIFARKGFDAATVRDICDVAGVNLASINYYFGDKQQLYIDTVFLAREMRVQHAPFPEWTGDTAPEEKLRGFVRSILKRLVAMESVPWQVHLLMREILQPTEACRQLVEEYFRPVFVTLLDIVDQLAESTLPNFKRQQIGFSIIGQCIHYRLASGIMSILLSESEYREHYDLEELTNHITDFSIAAIRNSYSCADR